jgi:hypothetical protein
MIYAIERLRKHPAKIVKNLKQTEENANNSIE